ncbi:MAG: 1-(5-phosphoribosyl)-5-[(5-phosphoribosylamino)methylideneamino]imidazole-4-carboxamide isomerase [Bacteroidota bacterium]
MRIIPAIDLIDGKCVRLTKGNYADKKVYNENPVEVAKEFESYGIKYLHLVDLDGAKAKRIINWNILESISNETNLIIDFGGGLRSDKDLQIAFASGASKITAGSVAATNKEMVLRWLNNYSSEKIILGADTINGIVSINAWQDDTELPLIEFIYDYHSLGFKETIVTDISKDGVLSGPAFDLYELIKKEIPGIQLIASGGISNISDIEKLNEMNIDGAIIGKSIYEGNIKLKELERFLC